MLTLSDAILQKDMTVIQQYLRYGVDLNYLDEYGFTPLIEAAIMDEKAICELLLAHGADPNQSDMTGNTALHWACENHHTALCTLLFKHDADPNYPNLAGQSPLVMPLLRQQKSLINLLIRAGASRPFAEDYIYTKLIGHLFELVGTAYLVDPHHQFIEVDFEGFYLEITLGLIADSLAQFQRHFAARELRSYLKLIQFTGEVVRRATMLIKYQQYRVDRSKYTQAIHQLIHQDPLIIPVGYEGHAITFIRYQDIWVKCDRREESRLYDNIVFYRISHTEKLTTQLIESLLFKKQDTHFINIELDQILGLTPITTLRIEAQISGNCSWANVEAAVLALFFLLLQLSNPQDLIQHKTMALDLFHRYREWNKDRSLHYCMEQYRQGDALRKACKAELLAAILFQSNTRASPLPRHRVDAILALLINSPYQYILDNYLRIYYYQSGTEEGKNFFELLTRYKSQHES